MVELQEICVMWIVPVTAHVTTAQAHALAGTVILALHATRRSLGEIILCDHPFAQCAQNKEI